MQETIQSLKTKPLMIKATFNEILSLLQTFEFFMNLNGSTKYKYWCLKNFERIKSFAKHVYQNAPKKPEIKDEQVFRDTVRKLQEKYGKRDAEGDLKTVGGNVQVDPRFFDRFTAKIKRAETKFKHVIDVLNAFEKGTKEYYEVQVDYPVYKLSWTELPDQVTPRYMVLVKDFILEWDELMKDEEDESTEVQKS